MADAINLKNFATSLTDFARDNKTHIFTRLLIPGMASMPGTPIWAVEDYMTMIPGNDEVVLTNIVVNNVLQPGGKDTFNPTNNAVTFANRVAKVRPCKIDLEFPHTKIMQLHKTYLGQVAGKKIDPKTYPFEAFVIDGVIKKAKENMRVMSLYNGVYNAAGNSPLDVFNGLLTQLTAAIAAGEVPSKNVTEHAALTSNNAIDILEEMIEDIPDVYFYSGLICVCNRKIKTAYEHNYRSRFTSLHYNTSTDKGTIDGTNIQFVVEPGLEAIESPIFTTLENLCFLYDDEGKQDNLDFDYQKRTRNLAYIQDFQAATGIGAAELIWTGQKA